MHGHLAEALGREVEAEEVFAAAAAGDAGAADAVERALSDAGRAIATMALVLNPELVVIGGGVATAGEALIAPLRSTVDGMVHVPPRLEATPLGARGPLLGAIRRALDEVEAQALDRPPAGTAATGSLNARAQNAGFRPGNPRGSFSSGTQPPRSKLRSPHDERPRS